MHNYATSSPDGDQSMGYRRSSYLNRQHGPDGTEGVSVYTYNAGGGGFAVSASSHSPTGYYMHVMNHDIPFRYTHGNHYFPLDDWFISVDFISLTAIKTNRSALLSETLHSIPDLHLSQFRIDRRFIS